MVSKSFTNDRDRRHHTRINYCFMATPSYEITCTQNEKIASDIYEIKFTKPDGFEFQAGQFLLLDTPLIESPDDIQPRAYSIASSPDEEELLFAMKMIPNGRASRWIQEVLEPGVRTEMKGPFGPFVLDQENPKEYVLVCTSTGVAPFRSQLMTVLAAGETRRIDLIFGVRNEEDLFWTEAFESLAKLYDNFYVHLALSNPSDEWKGHKGRVQTLVPQIISDFSNKNVYVCGNPDMTKEVKGLCLDEWGIEKKDLHVEGYI